MKNSFGKVLNNTYNKLKKFKSNIFLNTIALEEKKVTTA